MWRVGLYLDIWLVTRVENSTLPLPVDSPSFHMIRGRSILLHISHGVYAKLINVFTNNGVCEQTLGITFR